MQLGLFNLVRHQLADWFNSLPIWKQYDALVQKFNIKEVLNGKTQIDRVLWHLENFGKISNAQAHELYGIRHCPSVIREVKKHLEKDGGIYEIEKDPKKGCDRFGNPCVWEDYVLVKKENWNVSANTSGTAETENNEDIRVR